MRKNIAHNDKVETKFWRLVMDNGNLPARHVVATATSVRHALPAAQLFRRIAWLPLAGLCQEKYIFNNCLVHENLIWNQDCQ